jgi:protein TonB
VKDETLSIAFLISIAVHLSVIFVGAVVVPKSKAPTQELLLVNLIDAPRQESPPAQKIEASTQPAKPPPPPASKLDSLKERAAPVKAPVATTEPMPAPLPSIPEKEEPAKTTTPPNFASTARVEGGGSEIGVGKFFGKGDIGVMPGPGTTGGGGGTAASGLGRGSGAPGLPAQSLLRTNREAKPLQTVRANYPPMALRTGLESDVTLKIEVDAQGNVTKAEITKSGGAGFDEEALKAVKQSRFEPAQRDGQNVAAQFTYIYRFRLKR